MAYSDVLYEKTNGVAWITINRPEVRNAFRTKTVEERSETFHPPLFRKRYFGRTLEVCAEPIRRRRSNGRSDHVAVLG